MKKRITKGQLSVFIRHLNSRVMYIFVFLSLCLSTCMIVRSIFFQSIENDIKISKSTKKMLNPVSIKVPNRTCRYYIAQSSIPNSGWGIYTAIDIKEDDIVFQPEIIVPIIDIAKHNQKSHNWMPDSYVWQPEVPGIEFESDHVDAFIPGPGAIPNSYPELNNVGVRNKGSYDDCGLHRSKDPGAGAFSYYIYDDARAIRNISAGSEVFINYGEHWFQYRTESFGYVPLSGDFKHVDSTVTSFLALKSKKETTLSSEAISNLWELTKQISSDAPRVLNAFKITNGGDLKKIKEIGIARYSLPNSQTNLTWMQKNGLCIDNLHPAKSNIPQAGKGAFVYQTFHKGEVVAPLPLIHIAHNETVLMYDFNVTNLSNNSKFEIRGTQLLLNYCYSHKRSTLLLCPYGSAVNFVNHDSISPNVRIRWSNFKGTRKDWFNISVEELNQQKKAGLMLEFVAIRNISSGEEILLDYGKDWEDAWNSHVSNFIPYQGSHRYTSANQIKYNESIRTKEEQLNHPYPQNIMFKCFFKKIWTRNDIKEKGFHRRTRPFHKDDFDGSLKPCEILQRYEIDGETYYTVKILIKKVSKSKKLSNIIKPQITHMPRTAIQITDKMYTTDIHLKNAFRHPIGIPDEIFPSKWINIKMD